MAAAPPSTLNPDTGAEKWLVTRTRERHKAVHRLLARGWTISDIARELGLARHTAERYVHCKNLDGLVEGALRTTRLDDYKPYLIRRWNEGCTDAARLFREIQTQDYPGRTPQAVRRYLQPLRNGLGSIRAGAPAGGTRPTSQAPIADQCPHTRKPAACSSRGRSALPTLPGHRGVVRATYAGLHVPLCVHRGANQEATARSPGPVGPGLAVLLPPAGSTAGQRRCHGQTRRCRACLSPRP